MKKTKDELQNELTDAQRQQLTQCIQDGFGLTGEQITYQTKGTG